MRLIGIQTICYIEVLTKSGWGCSDFITELRAYPLNLIQLVLS
jgi:hypothetical protein